MSPISSRNMVPLSHCSNFPVFRASAPVKAPRSWPKSSLSTRFEGKAAQLTLTKERSARVLKACRARARRPLPVPDSPRNRTVASVLPRGRRKWTPLCRSEMTPLAHLDSDQDVARGEEEPGGSWRWRYGEGGAVCRGWPSMQRVLRRGGTRFRDLGHEERGLQFRWYDSGGAGDRAGLGRGLCGRGSGTSRRSGDSW